MKYLIVLIVVAAVVWLLLRGRKTASPAARSATPEPGLQAMLQCSHCGVHLPRAEALIDERGAFCTDAHRLAGPRGH